MLSVIIKFLKIWVNNYTIKADNINYADHYIFIANFNNLSSIKKSFRLDVEVNKLR